MDHFEVEETGTNIFVLVFRRTVDIWGPFGCTRWSWSRKLLEKKVLKLRQIVEVAGRRLENTDVTASLIGLKSIRVMQIILDFWPESLTSDEKQMLVNFFYGEESPD
ncbi:hypothetical protein AMECASPLE_032152, partial [Ameca splendens]